MKKFREFLELYDLRTTLSPHAFHHVHLETAAFKYEFSEIDVKLLEELARVKLSLLVHRRDSQKQVTRERIKLTLVKIIRLVFGEFHLLPDAVEFNVAVQFLEGDFEVFGHEHVCSFDVKQQVFLDLFQKLL